MAKTKDKDTDKDKKKESGSEPKTPDNSNDKESKKDSDKMIPKHRFDEVSSELKELKKWKAEQEKAQSEAEEETLKKQKKFEELAEKNKQRAEEAEAKLKTEQINNRIQAEAVKTGIKDIDAALKLIDRESININDDGEIEGIEDAVTNLVEQKPYLKEAEAEPSLGSGSNPPDSSSKPTITKFRLSQLQDHKFFSEHEEEIKKAMTIPGAIVDDIGVEEGTSAPASSSDSSGE